MTRRLLPVILASACALLAAAPAAEARPFAPPDAEALALREVPGHPGAPAVVLSKRAELRLAPGPGTEVPGTRAEVPGTHGEVPGTYDERVSTLEVTVRLKVLTEAGKRYGEVVVGHGATVRLEAFEGRTWLADGRQVDLPESAIFRQDRGGRRGVTKAAFPALEVGAIVDYRFRLAWRSSFFLEPWYFDEAVPVLRSELVYHRPPGLEVDHILRETGIGRYRVDETAGRGGAPGSVVRIWLEDLPPLIEEPYGFPFEDLAHRALVVPRRRVLADGTVVPLLDSWRTVCASALAGYENAARFSRAARKLARTTVKGLPKEAHAEALLALLRARVPAVGPGTVFVAADTSLDRVLRDGGGSHAEVGLLLATMLDAVGVPARLVWAGDWRDGQPDLEVVNPGWFVKTLVAIEDGGTHRFLDPGEPWLPAGKLAPTQEGTRALLVDAEQPRVIELPRSAADSSRRRAELDLALDDAGRLSGRGTLLLTGHHAWFYLGRLEEPAAVRAAWQQWLESRLESFTITDVAVEERPERLEITVSWGQVQNPNAVLGDESSVQPCRPLGPVTQRYTLPPAHRRTPVQVSFADRDEIELRLSWPAGWSLDLLPAPVERAGAAGQAGAEIEVDAEARRLVYRRHFAIDGTAFFPPDDYAALHELYAAMERHDAQALVLVRDG